jgi:hypothetical protein
MVRTSKGMSDGAARERAGLRGEMMRADGGRSGGVESVGGRGIGRWNE